jgi:DNA adenine methylase
MKGFLPWLGGKSRLAGRIAAEIARIEHRCYCEPFLGAGHVLFAKEPSSSEVLNDINRDLVTLFRVLQHHLEEFLRYFKWALVSRDEFERLHRQVADSLTDIQRAVRFYYLLKLSFGGKPHGRNFAMVRHGKPRLNLLRIEEELSAVHLRLAQVLIENVSWQECLRRHDGPATLFYIDPPYWGCEDDYGRGLFERADFDALAEALRALRGSFILSLNDRPEVRELFRGFHVAEVATKYTIGLTDRSKEVSELLISSERLGG